MNVASLLANTAATTPAATALYRGTAPLASYVELAERVARLAGFLATAGVAPGDRVAVMLGNAPAYVEVLYAILHAGAVAVPANAKLHEREFAYALGESGARVCFVDATTGPAAGRAASGLGVRIIAIDEAAYGVALRAEPLTLVARAADDLAWLFFTSGTTGQPKGAMLTHRNLQLMTASYLEEVDCVAPSDAILHAAPMSHGSGMYNFAHVARGAAQIFPESAGFDVAEVVALANQLTGIALFAAPTMVHRLVSGLPPGAALPGLKLIIYGGGPMLIEQSLRALSCLGPRLAQIYGQGECPMTISRLQRAEHEPDNDTAALRRRLASVGRPFGRVEVRVGDPDQLAQAGVTGEILVRSPIVMKGYWQREVATADAFERGWLRTGDVGSFDQDGRLHLSDRCKDVIISGGSNIYSREIEDVLTVHPRVAEVAVIGRPSEEWGEEVVAVIGHGSAEPPAREELDALCTTRIARFKRPRHYVFLRELPKNAYGKIEKRALKAQLSGHV